MEKLLLVNKKDQIIGYETKEKCHQGRGLLHRAFSIYIFNNKKQILIQRRSKFKKLWPLFWANSCCSHPRPGESYLEAGGRRLKEEMGFTCSLKLIDKFQYQVSYKNIGAENEICAILFGKYNGKVKPNRQEISSWKWVNLKVLKKDIDKNPQKYAPWFKIGLKRYLKIKERELKNKKKLSAFLKKTAKKIEPIAQELLELYIDKKFCKIISYQNSTGGKRLRPALAIISSNLLGGKMRNVLYPAAGLEILHNSTLIVDDIIDHSYLRRGKPTTWAKFGKSIAECVGLGYLASSFQGANRAKKSALISEVFIKTLKTIMMGGEIYDILFEQKGREDERYIVGNRYHKISQNEFLKMVEKKTAVLLKASCEVGGICAGGNKKQLGYLKNYGFNLGIAFQIQDDILDIFGEEKKFGKKIGKDIEERKLGNIVILLALRKLSLEAKAKILKIMKKEKITSKDIKETVKLINQTGARQEAYQLGKKFIEKAQENLNFLPKNKWNSILKDFANFVIEREI